MKNQYTGIAKGIEQPHLSTATHIITRTERGTIASWNRKYYKTDEQAALEKLNQLAETLGVETLGVGIGELVNAIHTMTAAGASEMEERWQLLHEELTGKSRRIKHHKNNRRNRKK